MANPKHPETPNPPRYDFTVIQLEVLDVYLQQMHVAEQKAEEARQSIKLFMSYVVKEQKLQENLSWNITAGADGKPYLTGATKTK